MGTAHNRYKAATDKPVAMTLKDLVFTKEVNLEVNLENTLKN